MRKDLAKRSGERRRFSGIFSRFGTKTSYTGYSEETILLTNIIDLETNQEVADHIWFAYTKAFQSAGLLPGRRVSFDARVREYSKGYVNKSYKINRRTTDYKLSHPTKIEML
jgi:hypothetical protein